MGEKRIHGKLEEDSAREFTRAILNDLNALERMITDDLIEDGIRRVGAEQEMALVDRRGCAAPVAQGMMQILHDDPRFQTEVALFNLEANLDPQTLGGPFLRHLEHELNDVLTAARRAASDIEADVVLTGILPSLRRSDVTRDNLTPEPRYALLDTVSLAAQDGEIRIAVDGLDRFEGRFDTVVVEGVNTSLQLHLQVNVGDAAQLYNLAQLITAPLLAASTNSPVIMGKRIWHETRVAVFERALDDRTGSKLGRGVPTRVGFGSSWLQDSLVELFKDNIARFPIIMTREIETDPMQELDRGEIPKLKALNLHNGTVWRWNRPCFGLTDGVPHLRIENRILPAGPTVLDEVANSALFYGLIVGLDDSYGEVKERLQFSQARENFIASAHYGLDARYTWLDGRRTGARELLLGELLPAARKGLASIAVPDEDIDRYIGVVEQRVESGRTGSSWLMEGLSEVPEDERPALSRHAVSLMLERQQADAGVHEWPHLRALESDQESQPLTLADIMTRDVFTVGPADLVDLATSMMRWRHFRHIPVEDKEGRLIGLLSARNLLQLQGQQRDDTAMAVAEIMERSPLVAAGDTSVHDAIDRMLTSNHGCVLVVRGDYLVGIVTERDILRALANS